MHGATVHGSWLTEAHIVVITAAGRLIFSYFGSKISPDSLIGWANGTCAAAPFKLTGARLGRLLRDSPLQRRACGEVVIQMNHSSARLSLPEWDIIIAPKAVPDWYHRSSGWISGPKVRLDVQFTLRVPERDLRVAPHGIVGQAFDGSGLAVDGARDPVPRPGLNLTTTANGEGAIEGSWRDYLVGSPFETGFRFSRFNLAEAPPRDVSSLTGRKFAAAGAAVATASIDAMDDATKAYREAD